MAAIETLFLAFALVLPAGGSASTQSTGRHYYAAVFLNRSHVSVGASANIGLFRRDGDSVWTNIYRPNLFTFGIDLWEKGSTRRYYIAAGNGLHRSVDGRRSWRILTDWRTEEILSVALDPVDSARIYIATPRGVFRSTDDGATWQKKSDGMKRGFVQKVVLDRGDRRVLYACSEDDLYCSTNSGETWKPMHVGVRDVMTVVQDPYDFNHLLVGTDDEGVMVSFDRGRTWKRGAGLPRATFYGVCVSSDKKSLYAGGYLTGLWKSVDGGRTWSRLWNNELLEAIYTVTVDQENPLHLMIGTSGQGIFESFDAGATWRQAGLRGCHVKQIELYL